jgi:N-acetyl-gamma-glutamyl-phosphate reductase
MRSTVVIGASGYTGAELIRFLLGHPDLELVRVTSDSEAGRPVADLYPPLTGCDLVYEPHEAGIEAGADVVFLAVPHTAAMAVAPALLDSGAIVIDHSADFRLTDAEVYREWYDVEHTAPQLLEEAVYGLPEVSREGLEGARLVACAGCYPTATSLATVPALESGRTVGERVVVDAKCGVAGAGRTPSEFTHYRNANEAVTPYNVVAHRHVPEIEQVMRSAAGHDVQLVFGPHLVPITRGLLSTAYMPVEGLDLASAHALYSERYAGEAFVKVLEPGRMPSTGDVEGSNRAHIGLAYDEHARTLVAVCAIDNLVKGSSGQAIQCANAVLGLPETTGLDGQVPVV